MTEVVGTLLRLGEFALGMSLLYLRFFLYETEEGRLQNYLAELWLRVSDQAASARQRLARLLDETARISILFLDRLFGPRLISIRAIVVSAALAMACAYVTFSWQRSMIPLDLDYTWITVEDLAWASVYIIGVIVAARMRSPWVLVGLAALVMILPGRFLFELIRHWISARPSHRLLLRGSALVCAIVAATLLDLIWLSLSRLSIRRAERKPGALPSIAVILVGAALSTAIFITLPAPGPYLQFVAFFNSGGRMDFVSMFVVYFVGTRLFIIAVSAVQIAVLGVLVAHRVFWPVLSRIVYAAERFQIFRDRKFFGTCGSALLVHAAGGLTWVAEVLKALRSGD